MPIDRHHRLGPSSPSSSASCGGHVEEESAAERLAVDDLQAAKK